MLTKFPSLQRKLRCIGAMANTEQPTRGFWFPSLPKGSNCHGVSPAGMTLVAYGLVWSADMALRCRLLFLRMLPVGKHA